MRGISEITDELFYSMEKFSQLIIDVAGEVEDELNDNEEVNKINLHALHYEIENIIEIIDPLRRDDIRILKELRYLTV